MKKTVILILALFQSYFLMFGRTDLPPSIEEKAENDSTLIHFKMKRSFPDEVKSMSMSHSDVGMVTYSSTRKSILELYLLTLPHYNAAGERHLPAQPHYDIAKEYALYSEDLKYIEPEGAAPLYSIEMSVSNSVGNFVTILRKQLDIAFNLRSSIVERDTEVLILREIKESESIRILAEKDGETNVSLQTMRQKNHFEMKGHVSSDVGFAHSLNGVFSKIVLVDDKRTDTAMYMVDLSINGFAGADMDTIIEKCREKGIILEKGIAKLEYLQIEKAE